jgi:hypothetical protein
MTRVGSGDRRPVVVLADDDVKPGTGNIVTRK